MIKIIINGREFVFEGNVLISASSEAIKFLKSIQEKEMVV